VFNQLSKNGFFVYIDHSLLNNYEMIEGNRYFQVGDGKKLRILFYYCILQEYFFSTVGHQ